MSKVAHYLQEHVVGEVMTSADMRRFFSTDGSVFSVVPTVVMYPRNENDVRKTTRFTWQLAERGRIIPMTARGLGTDRCGAAVGSGILMVFPTHMNKITELDGKSGMVTVQPGVTYGKLQQTLHTHGRYLPPYPSSVEFSTIGGAIANNAGGERSYKYGTTRQFVRKLRVILANGEVIETGRLSKREANKKMGLSSLEGEIYRSLDKLLEEHSELIAQDPIRTSQNTAGYDIWDVKRKDGSVDLTPLFVGSQGTLGIVTEATLMTDVYQAQATLIAASFDSLEIAEQALMELRNMSDGPSAIEMVDKTLLEFINKHQPNQLKDIITKPFPKMVMLIEFDNHNERVQKRLVKKAQKILKKYEVPMQVEHDIDRQEELWKIRRSTASLISHVDGQTRALPIIEDGIVPVERSREFISGIYEIFQKNHIEVAVWGHLGDGSMHVQPFLDLSQVGDRQKVFKLIDEYYKLVISLGGSTSAQYNDGRLRAPYLAQLYGQEIYSIFQKVKQIFDPYGTLNPGVKINVELNDIKPLLRHDFSLNHLYNHLPYN